MSASPRVVKPFYDLSLIPPSFFASAPPGLKSKSSSPRLRKDVLLLIARFADPQGRNSYPSIGRISTALGRSESSVRLALKDCEALGLLTCETRRGRVVVKDGQPVGRTNAYHLHLDALVERGNRLARETSEESSAESAETVPPISETVPPISETVPPISETVPPIHVGAKCPLNALIKSPARARDNESVSLGCGQASSKAWNLNREITLLTEQRVSLDAKHLAEIVRLMDEESYTVEEVLAGFKVFWSGIDPDNIGDVRYAGKNFAERADALLYAARRRKATREAEKAQEERGRSLLARQAEQEAAEREQRRKKQQAEDVQADTEFAEWSNATETAVHFPDAASLSMAAL